MQRPYEASIVDALMAISLRPSFRVELREEANPPHVTEALALQIVRRARQGEPRNW